jgi:DNA-binding HxlR family transcriptional regulator
MTIAQPYVRRVQILQALHEYGPLSSSALKEIVNPPMSPRGINTALKRLCDQDLVIRVHGALPIHAGAYYQLCRNEIALWSG